ncbi:lysozyme [Granulicella rosea]|uniref:Lysozyme n=1 Tax=Granulicella rosea TaxID=474952 RepID=A0A239DVM5_9BACT|nr:GH25 family lysozyme [Granulicella rosea]SNS36028.1 lysozyme [Granulicella rosea]
MDGRVHGIDVSHNNGAIDWDAASDAGIQFAFAKVSQGCDPTKPWYADTRFAENWPAMLDAGILRGGYHFIGPPLATMPQANWMDDIHSQIDHFLDLLGPLQPGDLPPVLDLENGDNPGRWQSLITADRAGALALVRELIVYTAAQSGVTPILYTGNFWTGELGDPSAVGDNMPFAANPLWLSQYPCVHTPVPLPGQPGKTDSGEAASFDEYALKLDGRTPLHMPALWGGKDNPNWTFWQFSAFGKIPAISPNVLDLDVFNGSLAQLEALTIPAPPAG